MWAGIGSNVGRKEEIESKYTPKLIEILGWENAIFLVQNNLPIFRVFVSRFQECHGVGERIIQASSDAKLGFQTI